MPDPEPLRQASDLVGIVTEVLKSSEKHETRGGPLVIVGRLYVSLTLILAGVTSVSAYLDSELATGHSVSTTVAWMRICLLVIIGLGIGLGTFLVWGLYKKHALMLYSPTELSEASQASLFGSSNEKVEQPPPPPPPTK